MYSPSWSPLPPPSPPDPSGSSQCTRSEHLSHASNLGWWSVSPQIIYMFQCCSLETSHPCLLPQSPKVCSILISSFIWNKHIAKDLCYDILRFHSETLEWIRLLLWFFRFGEITLAPLRHFSCNALCFVLRIFTRDSCILWQGKWNRPDY